MTHEKKKIGIVQDYLLEEYGGQIIRFYVTESRYFSNLEYVVNIDQISTISPQGIILKDNYRKVKIPEQELIALQENFQIKPNMTKQE